MQSPPRGAASDSVHAVLRTPLSSVFDASDPRPPSVQRLERTCGQLQMILLEQEKAIKTLEGQLKQAVTKNHMEIMLSGKVTQDELQALFTTLSGEITQLLGKKADYDQVESLLAGRASMSTIETLRTELNNLRDAIRSGDHLHSGSASAPSANPFEQQAQEMLAMLDKMRQAQKEAREREVTRRAELAAAAKDVADKDANAGNGVRGEEDELTTNQQAMLAQRQLDQKEKKELRDKIHRMELAIQLAHAQANARKGAGGASNGGGGSAGQEDDDARIERLVDERTAKMARLLEDLTFRASAAEKEGERLRKLMEAKHRAALGGMDGMGMGTGGAGGGLAGLGGMGFNELQRFMSELADTQRQFAQTTGQSGRHLFESSLLPRAAELAAQVQDMRNALREQQRAQARILASMSSAKSSVEGSVSDLYDLVVKLRQRLKLYSEEFARDVLEGVEQQRSMYAESQRFRSRVDSAFSELSSLLSFHSTTLDQLSRPLHDQLRVARRTELEAREEEVEKRYAGEYAKLRERYEVVKTREEEAKDRSSMMDQEEQEHLQQQRSSFSSRAPTGQGWNTHRDTMSPYSSDSRPGSSHFSSRPGTSSRTTAAEARRRSWAAAVSMGAAEGEQDGHNMERPRTGVSTSASSPRQAQRSASSRRPSTAAGSAWGRAAPLYVYTPSPSSAFQVSSAAIGQGPKWRPETERPHTSSSLRNATSPKRESSPQREETGRLIFPNSPTPAQGIPPRPCSSFSLKSASKSRPNTSGGGSGGGSLSRPSTRSGRGGGRASGRQTMTLTVENNDVAYSLELLRQRLSIPTSQPPPSCSNAAPVWSMHHFPSSPMPQYGPPTSSRPLHVPIGSPMGSPSLQTPAPQASPPLPYPAPATLHEILRASMYAPVDPNFVASNVHQPMTSLPGDAYVHSPAAGTNPSFTARAPSMRSGGSKSSRMITSVATIGKR